MSSLPHLCAISINAQSERVGERCTTVGYMHAWCFQCNTTAILSGEHQSVRAALDALDDHGDGSTHEALADYSHLDDYFQSHTHTDVRAVIGRCNIAAPTHQPVRCPRPAIARPGKLRRRPHLVRNARLKCA